MTMVLPDLHLVDEFDQPKILRGCVFCGRLVDQGDHDTCRRVLRWSTWNPCLHCNGSRFDLSGPECLACFGIGFIEDDTCASIVGRGYTPDAGSA